MKKIIAWYRISHVVLMTIFWLIILVTLQKIRPKKKRSLARFHKRHWAKRLLKILKIQVVVHGKLPDRIEGCIITPNHRTYLDIPVVMAIFDCSMLSKAEVAKWPVIGLAARAVGTIFVKREDKNSRASSLERIARFLEKGWTVNVFPEGTTFVSPEIGPFKPGVFNLAVQSGAHVIPVRIEYDDKTYEWIGEDSALQHFFKKPGWSKTVVHLYIGEPTRSETEGKELKESVEQWIRNII